MSLLLVSFLAGILTILAPCVLTLLPIILGGALETRSHLRPLIIIASLAISVILFSLLLKGSTILLGVPDQFWKSISGSIVLIFGITMLFPDFWERIVLKLRLYKSENLIQKSQNKHGNSGLILLGASLGPVFTTCSPTYSLILAVILPSSFFNGFINLVSYSIGLALILLAIAFSGQSLVKKLRFAANPQGWFKRSLGLILILTGISIISGFDKKIETKIIESGYFGPIKIEQSLIKMAS